MPHTRGRRETGVWAAEGTGTCSLRTHDAVSPWRSPCGPPSRHSPGVLASVGLEIWDRRGNFEKHLATVAADILLYLSSLPGSTAVHMPLSLVMGPQVAEALLVFKSFFFSALQVR